MGLLSPFGSSSNFSSSSITEHAPVSLHMSTHQAHFVNGNTNNHGDPMMAAKFDLALLNGPCLTLLFLEGRELRDITVTQMAVDEHCYLATVVNIHCCFSSIAHFQRPLKNIVLSQRSLRNIVVSQRPWNNITRLFKGIVQRSYTKKPMYVQLFWTHENVPIWID